MFNQYDNRSTETLNGSYFLPNPQYTNDTEPPLPGEIQFRCSFCKVNNHLSMECPKIGPQSALKIARKNRLCFICLLPLHTAFQCPVEVTCDNHNCHMRREPPHGKLLCQAFQNKIKQHSIPIPPQPTPPPIKSPALKKGNQA